MGVLGAQGQQTLHHGRRDTIFVAWVLCQKLVRHAYAGHQHAATQPFARIEQKACFRQRHGDGYIRLHGVLTGGAVVSIDAGGYVHGHNLLAQLIKQLAGSLSCRSQLTAKASAEDGVHYHAGPFQGQL